MRRPIFVPGTQLISATLENLRRQRSLMAVVTGEDGTAIGLVTIEDLLEEIVGEIQDEFDEGQRGFAAEMEYPSHLYG